MIFKIQTKIFIETSWFCLSCALLASMLLSTRGALESVAVEHVEKADVEFRLQTKKGLY